MMGTLPAATARCKATEERQPRKKVKGSLIYGLDLARRILKQVSQEHLKVHYLKMTSPVCY